MVSLAPDAAPAAEVTWKSAAPGRFVLWPVSQPWGAAAAAVFAFQRLGDLYVQERQAAVRVVGAGNFEGADQRPRRLRQLLVMYGDPAQVVIPGVTMGALEFKLVQEIGAAAADYRDAVGRWQVSDAKIQLERAWRKLQFSAARKTGRPATDLATALNDWALLTRQSYSVQQRAWPDRPILADPRALADPSYAALLREDLGAVGRNLAWLRDEAPAATRVQRLSEAQR